MIKRRISEYSSFVILLFCMLLIYYKLLLPAFLVYIIWYCLFGMVGLAFLCNTKGKIKLSEFFLKITIPATLLPLRRSFYYWTKSVNVIMLNPAHVSEAYEIAQKVKVDNLYTDNNKSFFLCFLAALLNDLGQREKAYEYIKISQQLPHNSFVDVTLERLKKAMDEETKKASTPTENLI